jgi:hypothetical protein
MILSVRICLTPKALLVIENPEDAVAFIGSSSMEFIQSTTEKLDCMSVRTSPTDFSANFSFCKEIISELDGLPSKLKAMLESLFSPEVKSKLEIEVCFTDPSEIFIRLDASPYFAPSTDLH